MVGAWRARAVLEYPSDLRERPRPVRLTLLAALCWTRTGEITDGLVELLIGIVHKIGTRAENRVEGELLADLRRVRGKEGILFRLAEAAVEHPDDTVRTALYPVVSEATLRDLVKEAKATEAVFKTRVRKALRSSYSNYYRRMLPRLLGALQFRSNNSAHRPVIEALDLLGRYAERPGTVRFYAGAETVPLAGVVPADWETAVVDERGRVKRIPYELCVLRALRDGLRRREIWVAGANRWWDPEADLPADFEVSREVHYTALRQPLDPSAFVGELRRRMRTEEDRRALTPLFWTHVNPYGSFSLHGPPPRPRPPRGSDMTVPAPPKRTPARQKARQLAKHLRAERPDYAYLKEVFRHLRAELDVEVQREAKRLPYVPSEDEIRRYYQTVWTERRGSDVVLIKTLLYTGVRVAELVAIRLNDVDLDACHIRITQGKGNKDRVVPFPTSFKETLGLHMDAMRSRGAVHLFESSWKKPYSTCSARAMLARYAKRAGMAHPVSPHRLRHFLFTWVKTQGIDDALIQPYSGHASRQSLEVYSRIALADAQHSYDQVIDRFPV